MSSPFNDRIGQSDGVAIALNCGLCGQPAESNHSCVKRYLRNPRMVLVRSLAEPDSNDPRDLFLVQVEKGGEEYATTREILKRDYEEL